MRTEPHWLRTQPNPRYPFARNDVVSVKGTLIRVKTSTDYGSRGPVYDGWILSGPHKGYLWSFYASEVTRVIGRYNPEGLQS